MGTRGNDMAAQDTRVIVVSPSGETIFQESGGGSFSRTLRSLWLYSAQGALREFGEKDAVHEHPEFGSLLQQRVVKSHCFKWSGTTTTRVIEGERKRLRAMHQVFFLPVRVTALMFGHHHAARDVLLNFPSGSVCMVILDDWSKEKKTGLPLGDAKTRPARTPASKRWVEHGPQMTV